MEFATLRAFLAVVDAGSFACAADETGVSRMTLSRRVDELERLLGEPVLVRSGAGAEPTTLGLALTQRGRELVSSYEDALTAARGTGARIVVVVDPELLDWVADSALLERAALEIKVAASPLQATGADRVSVVRGPRPKSSRTVRQAGQRRLGLMGHGDYLAIHGRPRSIEELHGHVLLATPGESALPLRTGGSLSIDPRTVLPARALVARAVHAGRGLGLVTPTPGLEWVLGDEIGIDEPVWLVGDPRTLDVLGPTGDSRAGGGQ